MDDMVIEPVVLEGEHVRLEPLGTHHLSRLIEIGTGSDIFQWYAHPVRTEDEMRAFVDTALREQAAGVTLPFATVARTDGLVVGSTRFANIDRANRRAEIGWTWIAPGWQRSAINTEAKYLMMQHAFGVWAANRVEFKTDSFNERSRAALRRIGATEEGTLRNHMVTASGRLRHSVMFSVVREEWPRVRSDLEAKMKRPSGRS
jgi:RimJ/RimL family protein N-acetyltransferase